jgi:hypothetical protein
VKRQDSWARAVAGVIKAVRGEVGLRAAGHGDAARVRGGSDHHFELRD